jgi:hypothetical protein
MRPTTAPCDTPTQNNVFELDALLYPGTVFEHPDDVVTHPELSLSEKRAIPHGHPMHPPSPRAPPCVPRQV